MFKVTPALVQFTISFEEFSPVPKEVAPGAIRIGYGHKVGANERFSTLTEHTAKVLLEMDLESISREVQALVEVSLNKNQHDVLVDLVYSSSLPTFKYGKILALLNGGEPLKAANKFGSLVYRGKERSSALIRRRSAEKVLFVRGG